MATPPIGAVAAGVRHEPARRVPAVSLRPGVVIAAATALALALRLFQLSRPGYLTGAPQYDDGVYLGNALRLVQGVIPYRDFAMVQPPGSMLLMAPVAVVAKAVGTARGFALARLLTVAADTASTALAGLLVRHRGSLAAGLASAGYAVYPAVLVASQSLLLEPWLNLFCLLGALVLYRRGDVAGVRRSGWSGACFGFATAVKIWAVVPALIAAGTAFRARGRRGGAWFAAGFAVGLGVPCLPFLVLAPSGFGRTVFVSELIQAGHGRFGPRLRLADITGLVGLSGLDGGRAAGLAAAAAIAAVLGLLVALAWVLAWRASCTAAAPAFSALEWYVLISVVVVTVMMFAPSEWYEHYAAFDGPFVVLAAALPVARLVQASGRTAAAMLTAGTAALVVIVMSAAALSMAIRQPPAPDLAAADRIIPAGACVVTDTVSETIAADRFISGSPGCPAVVDSVGTLIATTGGREYSGGPSVWAPDTAVWLAAFRHAQYVWLVGADGDTGARIAWTRALRAYFDRHFRLVRFASTFRGRHAVPRGGLYQRT